MFLNQANTFSVLNYQLTVSKKLKCNEQFDRKNQISLRISTAY